MLDVVVAGITQRITGAEEKTMTEPNRANEAPVHPNCYRAVREFCFRWKCECGHVNLQETVVAGYSNVCGKCGLAVKIVEIEYGSGAVLKCG